MLTPLAAATAVRASLGSHPAIDRSFPAGSFLEATGPATEQARGSTLGGCADSKEH